MITKQNWNTYSPQELLPDGSYLVISEVQTDKDDIEKYAQVQYTQYCNVGKKVIKKYIYTENSIRQNMDFPSEMEIREPGFYCQDGCRFKKMNHVTYYMPVVLPDEYQVDQFQMFEKLNQENCLRDYSL